MPTDRSREFTRVARPRPAALSPHKSWRLALWQALTGFDEQTAPIELQFRDLESGKVAKATDTKAAVDAYALPGDVSCGTRAQERDHARDLIHTPYPQHRGPDDNMATQQADASGKKRYVIEDKQSGVCFGEMPARSPWDTSAGE